MAVALVALFAALAGGAYAASSKAPKNSVVSRSIKNGQVKSADLANGGVKGVDLGAGAVGADKLAAGSVGAGALADGSVGASALADGAVGPAKLAPGAVGAAALAPDAVDGTKIADGSVAAEDIGAHAVGAEELANVVVVSVKSAATTDADGTTNGGEVGIAKATATCPPGTVLLGGGSRWVDSSNLFTSDKNVYVQEEYAAGLAWTAEGVVDFGAQGNIKIQAQAFCLDNGVGPASS